MPLYEYKCTTHGVFERLRSMSECRLPADCPTCQMSAVRILSRPHLTSVSPAERIARDRNERSRHEPQVARTPCGHTHHAPVAKPPARTPQVYKGPRPWVMEHA